jgi:protein arginine kinase activator
MVCELCKTKHATIHITEIVSGQKKELHLCHECAQKKGVTHKIQLSLSDLLGGMIEKKAGSKALKGLRKVKCPNCGISFKDLKSKVRLGCTHDLEIFKEWLGPFIEKIHGTTQHVGKLPKNADETQKMESELLKLKRSLEDAVRREDFEKAAHLRDKIRSIEGGAA